LFRRTGEGKDDFAPSRNKKRKNEAICLEHRERGRPKKKGLGNGIAQPETALPERRGQSILVFKKRSHQAVERRGNRVVEHARVGELPSNFCGGGKGSVLARQKRRKTSLCEVEKHLRQKLAITGRVGGGKGGRAKKRNFDLFPGKKKKKPTAPPEIKRKKRYRSIRLRGERKPMRPCPRRGKTKTRPVMGRRKSDITTLGKPGAQTPSQEKGGQSLSLWGGGSSSGGSPLGGKFYRGKRKVASASKLQEEERNLTSLILKKEVSIAQEKGRGGGKNIKQGDSLGKGFNARS